MVRTRAILVALALLGWAGFAHALGLGEIEVRSRLNQPISAFIPVAAAPGETDDLVVQLASNDEFDRAGLERSEFLSSLRFEVQGDTIKVISKQIAREPFVSFLLDVRWGGGRLLREYTVLLDPPALAQSAPTRPAAIERPAQATPPAAEAAPSEPATAPDYAAAPEAPAPEAPAAEAPAAAAASGGETYGPVSPKETLWSIAYKLRPDPALTMDQMQVAILNANPQAFHQGKLTGLMKGATLRIPTVDEIRAVDPVSAKSQVAAARETGPSTPAPAPSYEAAAPQAAPEPAPAPTPAPEPVAEAPPVEVPPPAEQVAQAPAEAPPPEQTAQPAPPPEPQPAPAEEPKTEPAPQPQAAPPAPEEPGMVAELLERGRGFTESPFFIPAAAGILVLLILVIGGRKLANKVAQWRYERASRKPQVAPAAMATGGGEEDVTVAAEPSMESALQEAASGDVTTVAPTEGVAATQAVGDQTLQQTQVQEPALAQSGKVDFDVTGAFNSETVQINLDAGDPVSEAEFHRAYGLYDEAALLLKQALQKDPKRTDAKVKLAEIYFEASKANEFVEVARELKAQLPESEWQKIALLGTQIAPGHEMFSGGAGGVGGSVDLSFDEPAAPAAPSAPAPASAPAAPAADLGLDFKLEDIQLPESPAESASAPAAPAGDSLEFDLGSLEMESPAAPAETPAAAPPAAEEKLDLGEFDLSSPAESAAAGGDIMDLGTEVSMESPAGAGDESSTKLDLARAYIDMGDGDMAKSLLNEVVQQGSAEQQKEAQELLKRVSG